MTHQFLTQTEPGNNSCRPAGVGGFCDSADRATSAAASGSAPGRKLLPSRSGVGQDVLPRRVREGEERERTLGQVMLAGTSVGQMISGRDGTWTSDIQRRLRELGVRVRIRLENHVEMKVAQMMIHAGSRPAR